MSGRGPDPKELRASLVDSGWSSVPPPEVVELRPHDTLSVEQASDRLPNYDDVPQVTQVDQNIQERLKAMQRVSLVDAQRPALPHLPPPPSVAPRPAPPSLPPPPRPSAPPPLRSDVPLPSFDTPPIAAAPSGPRADAPLPSFDSPIAEAAVPLPSFRESHIDSEPAEPTMAMGLGAVLPPSDPPELAVPSSLPTAPSLLSALKQRVRFAGGEVPLWSLLAPMVLLLLLGSAFVAAAIGAADPPQALPLASASSATPPAPIALPKASEGARELSTAIAAPALPANATDAEALEARRAEELSKDEALTLASTRRQRDLAHVALLRQKLARDPGLFKDAALMAELRRAAEDPLTAADALSAMADAPGPLSADLLYEIWTGTVARNSATELARSLVFSKEVRAKASPELAVALELRIAESCEQNRALLPRALDKGDRRSLALLAKLARRFGCGANKRQDCYPCLREDKAVDEAMAAVKKRREPKPFLGK